MAGWRDHKAKARAAVHRTFEVPAVYLTHAAGTPIACLVRIHTKITAQESEFTWPSAPGYLEIDPYVIFRSDQVEKPLLNSLLIVGPLEMYRLGASEPSREGYAKTSVSYLNEQEIAELLTQIDTEAAAYEGIV